jgi:hypothetical protein
MQEMIEVRITCSYSVRHAVADKIQKGLHLMGFQPTTYPRYERAHKNDCNTLIYQTFVATQLDY